MKRLVRGELSMRMTFISGFAFSALALGLAAASPATAQSTTYVLSSGPFDPPGQFLDPCDVPTCRTLSTAAATGTVTLSAPLPANAMIDATSMVTAYSVTAAGLTIESTDPLARLPALQVLTNASSGIDGFYLDLQRLASATYGVGDTDPNARLDSIALTSTNSLVWANFFCSGGRLPDGTCYSRIADDSSSTTFGGPGRLIDPNAVPTLSEWAMLLTGLALALIAAGCLRRGRASPAT